HRIRDRIGFTGIMATRLPLGTSS
ncbi:hypothetical protein SSYM_1981, partial [Serratia symbiotica str. Tucson]